MQTTDTKGRILASARELFEERGLDGFSVRAVTARAGTNVAAVNYHFGSKSALLRALVREAFDGVVAEQGRSLAELERRDNVPTVGEILTAYAAPVFALYAADHAGEWGRAWMEARAADPSGQERPPTMPAATDVTRRYLATLQRALPHVPPDELRWRLGRTTGLLMANQGRRASRTDQPAADEPVPEDERRWLLAFLAGALAAPGDTDAEKKP